MFEVLPNFGDLESVTIIHYTVFCEIYQLKTDRHVNATSDAC